MMFFAKLLLYGGTYEKEKDKYFQQTVLSYKDGMYSENSYGISFPNNKEEYFNHDNSFEIINIQEDRVEESTLLCYNLIVKK